MNEQCDVGGTYWYPSQGPAVYKPPCPNPPTYRWHQTGPDGKGWAEGWVPGHWNYRCDTHVRWLSSTPSFVIEPFVLGAKTP